MHVLMQESAAIQVRDLERVKNKLREVFKKIDAAALQVTKLKAQLGPNQIPTALNARQRVALAKLAVRVERDTVEADAVDRCNAGIRRKIDELRMLVLNSKNGIIANRKRVKTLKANMVALLREDMTEENLKLERKIERVS